MMADIFLYVCIYVCACVVLFDILFGAYVYRSERILPKRVQKMQTLLTELMLIREGEDALHAELRAQLSRWLAYEGWVQAFLICNAKLKMKHRRLWAKSVRSELCVFAALARVYDDRASEYKTLFARMITDLSMCRCVLEGGEQPGEHAELAEMAQRFEHQMLDPSAFLRQNAFRALVSLGDAETVASAFVHINREPALINEKLMSDDLLAFPGDIETLMALLWVCFFELTPQLQTCIINFFRLLPASRPRERYQQMYYEDIRTVMMDENADEEVRYAAIRYFRKHSYPAARASLMELLRTSENDHTNFAAIAATSLQSYPGKDTEQLLIDSLHDPDWYVRFNSAESLIHFNVDYERIVLESDDRYAKQMLIYRAEVRRLRGKNGAGA